MNMEKLRSLLSEVIKKIPNTENSYDFDAHDVIRKLITLYPDDFELLLSQQKDVDTEHAIHRVHMTIGNILTEMQGIKYKGKHESPNYKGEAVQNSTWKKI